jgi:hypothetical protein
VVERGIGRFGLVVERVRRQTEQFALLACVQGSALGSRRTFDARYAG